MGSIILVFMFLLKVISAIGDDLFKSVQGGRVANFYKTIAISDLSKIFCTQFCVLESKCISASFHKTTLSCELSVYHPANIAGDFTKVDEWILLYRANGLKDIGTAVFRGTAGVGIDLDLSYLEKNSLPVPDPGCYSRESVACNTHVRSSWIDDWTDLNIKEVRVEMLREGQTVAFVTFKNTETDDKKSWFKSQNIINSSWTDLPSYSVNSISVLERVPLVSVVRSFRVYHTFDLTFNCLDEGWMLVSEIPGSSTCSYDSHAKYPVFMYITASTTQLWKSNFGIADVMMISIKA